VALLAGYGALLVVGLEHHQSVVQEGITARRVVAAALSLAVTGLVAHLLKAQHAPSGATTLIVSLGILHTGEQLGWMAVAIVLATALAWVANALAGVYAPVWSSKQQPELRPERAAARLRPS
jgi:CBS-domain-containing membrane protein